MGGSRPNPGGVPNSEMQGRCARQSSVTPSIGRAIGPGFSYARLPFDASERHNGVSVMRR